MYQPAEPASAAAHTRRLSGEATSSDGEKEALESPEHMQSEWLLLLFASLSCSRAVCVPLSSTS